MRPRPIIDIGIDTTKAQIQVRTETETESSGFRGGEFEARFVYVVVGALMRTGAGDVFEGGGQGRREGWPNGVGSVLVGAEEAVRRVPDRVRVRYGNVKMEGGERVGLFKGGDDLWIGSGGKDGVEDEMGFGGHFRCLDSTEGRK